MRCRLYTLSGALLLTTAALLPARQAQGHGMELSLRQFGDGEFAMVADQGRIFTVGELKQLLAMRSARFRPMQALIYGVDDLLQQGRVFPLYTKYAQAAPQPLTPEEERLVEQETQAYMRRLLFRREVTNKVPNPSLETLRSLYEEVKDERLRTPERLVVRRVLLPFQDAQTEEEARAKAEEIHAELSAGAPITTVLRQHGLAAPAQVIYPDQEPNKQLIEALLQSGDRQPISPVRLDQAYEIYVRQLHIPADHIAFEPSLELLSDTFIAAKTEELAAALFARIDKDLQLIRLVPSNLMTSGEMALDSDVLLFVGGEPIERQTLHQAIGWLAQQDAGVDFEEFRKAAMRSGVVQNLLLDAAIEDRNMAQDSEVQFFRQQLRTTLLARNALLPQVRPTVAQPTDEEVFSYWLEQKATEGMVPGLVQFDLLELPGDGPAPVGAQEQATGCRTQPCFDEVAEKLMEELPQALMMSGLQDHIRVLPHEVKAAAESGDLPRAVWFQGGEEEAPHQLFWVREYEPDEPLTDTESGRLKERLVQNRVQDALEELLLREAESLPVEVLINTEL